MSLRRKKKKCRLAGLKTMNKIRYGIHMCTREAWVHAGGAHTHIPRLAKPPRCTPQQVQSQEAPHHICTALGLPCPLACTQSEASWEVVPERMASGPVTSTGSMWSPGTALPGAPVRKPAELLGGGHGWGWGMRVPTVMPPTPPRAFLRRGNQIPWPLSLSPSCPTPEGSQPYPQRPPHLAHTN